MALSPEFNRFLMGLIEEFENDPRKCWQKEREFLTDTVSRYEEYGEEIRLTIKQRSWLVDIGKKYNLDYLEDYGEEI